MTADAARESDDARAAERAAHATAILNAAIAAANPAPAVQGALADAVELRTARRIHVLAVGKAADPMTRAALAALPRHHDSVLVVVPHGTIVERSPDVRTLHAAHPVPDETSVAAAAEVERMLSAAADDDVVIVLISGGASSLCAAPVAGITIDDYAALVDALLHAGADIRELNTVRRHIDRLKGGGMARLIAPARALGLMVSDVVGDPLDVIASGPLSPNPTTAGDAVLVLERYGLWDTSPASVRRVLTRASESRAVESPASASRTPDFAHVSLRVLIDNHTAVRGAAAAAAALGYDVRVNEVPVTGAARDAGSSMAREAMAVARSLEDDERAVCMLSGGETTVVVSGTGTGGRNQELALAAALELRDVAGVTVASVGTDGIDGPTDTAGAVVDGKTVLRGAHVGSDAALALDNNDSHSFFIAAGGLIRTGPTGTNVMDVQVILVDPLEIQTRND